MRDLLLQRGYVPDDILIYSEVELRKGTFHENILRESCHPYQWLFFRYRRMRYYKIERCLQGFFVPDWLRQESSKRTWADALKLENKWNEFVFSNWMSDMTPATYFGRGKRLVLEFMSLYGIWRAEAWERIFLNEKRYDCPTEEEVREAYDSPFGLDLDTEEGRRQFESKMNHLNKNLPGFFARENEAINFNHIYAVRAVQYNKDTSKFTEAELEKARQIVEDKTKETEGLYLQTYEDKKVGKSQVGTAQPRRLRKDDGETFMS